MKQEDEKGDETGIARKREQEKRRNGSNKKRPKQPKEEASTPVMTFKTKPSTKTLDLINNKQKKSSSQKKNIFNHSRSRFVASAFVL